MGSRAIVLSLFVTCYLSCILCRNASGSVSTFTKVFTINDTSQLDATIFKTENTRIAESIEIGTRLDGITFFPSPRDFHTLKIPYESSLVKDKSVKRESSSNYRNIRAICSRYCVEHLESSDYFQNITFVSSFTKNNEEKEDFSIENISNLTNSKILSIPNDKSLINLDNCKIYFILDCNIIEKNPIIYNQEDDFYTNSEIYTHTHTQRENINSFFNIIPEFSTKLVHSEANLSGHTEANLNIDPNITRIVIKTFGNLTRIVLTVFTNRTMREPRIPISLTHTYTTKGVVIGARNLPPGRLCVKLTGVENSKYSFNVTTYFGMHEEINRKNDMKIDIEPVIELTKEENVDNKRTNSSGNKVPKFVFERSVEIMNLRNNNDDEIINNFLEKDMLLSSAHESASENISNSSILENKSLISSYGDVKLPTASNKMFNENLIVLKQQQTIQARSSEVASLNENIDMNVIDNRNLSKEIANKNQEISAIARNGEEFFEQLSERKNVIEVNTKSSLIATPGTTHRVVFDVTNNCFLPVRYAIRAKSTPFRIYSILPVYMWLRPGQTGYVTVDIIVPLGTQNSINTLTLSIDETEISQKIVYIYVQDSLSRNFDDVKPTLEYSFNSNCAGKLNKDRCDKTFWSVDITAQDSDSGLKRVISTPNRIYSRTEFISGTKERITFYYSSTCCSTTAKITAIDVFENQYSRTIDVTEWDNLSQGEIAAISLGALLLLFLLILLIIGIVYCVRRRSSHDLSYSQRYGSRPRESRSERERTSF